MEKIIHTTAIGLLTIILLFLIALGIDGIFCDTTHSAGVILEKSYKPDTQNVSVVFTPNGKQPGVVATGDPEEWVVIVQQFNGSVISVTVSSIDYYKLSVGDTIQFSKFTGCITGANYGNSAK